MLRVFVVPCILRLGSQPGAGSPGPRGADAVPLVTAGGTPPRTSSAEAETSRGKSAFWVDNTTRSPSGAGPGGSPGYIHAASPCLGTGVRGRGKRSGGKRSRLLAAGFPSALKHPTIFLEKCKLCTKKAASSC